MFLTKEEERMYNGEEGKALEDAMKKLVRLGEAYDAEKMIDINYAHCHSGMAMYRNDVKMVEDLANEGAFVRVPATTTVVSIDMDRWKEIGIPQELAQLQLRIINVHKRMGMVGTYTCQPNLLGYLPSKGSHISSIESSAIIFYNSVLGARTNRDGFFTVYAAITGKYPLCGYHLNENRVGTHLVEIDTNPTCSEDYGALGFYVGTSLGRGVPVFSGIKNPTLENLKALGASLAIAGAFAIYHISGVTPEARTIKEAFSGEKPMEKITIGNKEVAEIYESLRTTSGEKIDFVALGCPHYSIEEIRRVSLLLKGKKIHKGVMLWVCTSRAAKAMADRMGYTDEIERAGGLIVCDTCPSGTYYNQVASPPEMKVSQRPIETMITDSAKMAKVAWEAIKCGVIYARLEDCIEAAISGVWS